MEKEKASISFIVGVIVFVVLIVLGSYIAMKRMKPQTDPLTATTGTEPVTLPDDSTNPPAGTKPGSTTTPTKNNMENTNLKITTTQEGSGPAIVNGQTASMLYTGKLDNGQTFDSNVDPAFHHPEPFEYTLGAGQVIKGWDLGVLGMKVGEKRTLVIPADLAYGSRGVPGVIPPGATLTFTVELKAIK
jgi:FKBP-type peptidyl-prolyl cis-trans isomerase